MKRLLRTFYIIFFLFALACNNDKKSSSANKTPVNIPGNTQRKIEVRIFSNDTITGSNLTGFGYDIQVNGSSYIHQPHIPAVSGLKGFLTEEDARTVGEYISKKFEMTNTLPVITSQELDSLGIKY